MRENTYSSSRRSRSAWAAGLLGVGGGDVTPERLAAATAGHGESLYLRFVQEPLGRLELTRWQRRLCAEPAILGMTRELNAIREQELEKTLASLSDLTDKQRDEVEYLTKRIVNKILQRPMSQLKEEITQEDPHRILHLVKRLFGIEDGV